MNPCIEILRLNIGFLAILGLTTSLLLLGIPSDLWVLPILAVFLITSSGNVINDFFDFKIDKINKPKRPLPSKKITRKKAFILYLFLASFGLAISFFVSFNFFLFAFLNSIIVFLYSWKFKRTILGNAIDSYLACSIFIAPLFILYSIEKLNSSVTVLAIIAFLGNYGREILKDIEDIRGDRALNIKTLPIVLGNLKAMIIGKILIFIASLFLFLPYILGFFSELYLILASLCFLITIYSLKINDVRKLQRIIKLIMFLIIFSFLITLLD